MGDLVPIRPPFSLWKWFMGWLASPVRVFALPVRLFTAIGIAVPIYYAITLHAPGILLFEVVFSLPMWMFMALAVHGPTAMFHSNPPMRLWLWRHVTAWWATPIP